MRANIAKQDWNSASVSMGCGEITHVSFRVHPSQTRTRTEKKKNNNNIKTLNLKTRGFVWLPCKLAVS